jgi:hypothetical protein
MMQAHLPTPFIGKQKNSSCYYKKKKRTSKSKDNFYVLLLDKTVIFATFVLHLFRVVDQHSRTLVQVGLTGVDYLQENKIMVNDQNLDSQGSENLNLSI